jgi:hypothetical protein
MPLSASLAQLLGVSRATIRHGGRMRTRSLHASKGADQHESVMITANRLPVQRRSQSRAGSVNGCTPLPEGQIRFNSWPALYRNTASSRGDGPDFNKRRHAAYAANPDRVRAGAHRRAVMHRSAVLHCL